MTAQSVWPQTMMWGTFKTAREFDGGSTSALHGAVWWHHVAGVSQNKELPGISLCEERGVDSRIGTGNEERSGSLIFRKPGEEFLLFAEHLGPKLEETFDKFFHCGNPPYRLSF